MYIYNYTASEKRYKTSFYATLNIKVAKPSTLNGKAFERWV